jgi:hypothetical protein
MLRKANNVFSVLLNDGTVASSTLPAVGAVVTPTNLPTGAIVLVDAGMRRLDNATPGAGYSLLADGDGFFVVQGRGTTKSLMKSPRLTKGKVKFTSARHKDEVQQVTAIGFNGTTGALPVANNTDFWIKIRKRDNDAANRSQPMSLFAGPVRTSTTGATQAELASALVRNGYLNFKDEPANHYLKFEALVNSTGTATAGAVSTLGVVNGSRTVTLDAAMTIVAGDYIRLGGTTGFTFPVYKVNAVTATSLLLDSPYTGDTATLTASTASRKILATTAATADFGVTVTGIAAPFDVNQFRDYYANRFTATFSDSSTLLTHLVGAYNGNGMWQQVAMDEYMSYGFEGENQQLATPSVARDQFVKIPGIGSNTELSSRYSALNISWEESISGLVSMDGGKGNVIVYLNLDSSSPLGLLATTPDNNGETFVQALGLTVADFNMV